MSEKEYVSKTPYLVKAVFDWILDSGLTPYILVNNNRPGVEVPQEYVQPNGTIVLNIRPAGVEHFLMNNDGIYFSARFNKVSRNIVVPMDALLSIYPAEHPDDGMIIPIMVEVEEPVVANEPEVKVEEPEKKRPFLSIVKND